MDKLRSITILNIHHLCRNNSTRLVNSFKQKSIYFLLILPLLFTFKCCFCCSVKHSCQVRCEKNSLKILLFSHKPCGSCKRAPSMWNSSKRVDSCDNSDSTEDPSEDMVEYSSSIFEPAHETE